MVELSGVAPSKRRKKLSAAGTAARQPLPPDELVGALQNSVHRDKANSRGAKTVRNKRSDRRKVTHG